MIVVDKKGIKYDALKSMNMQMTDLLQAMRTAGYFCLDQIAYAIFETNGQLSVVPYPDKQNSTVLPVAVIVDGQWSQTELDYYHVDKDKIQKVLQKRGLDETNVIIATLDENSRLLVYPQQGAFFEEYIDGEKQ